MYFSSVNQEKIKKINGGLWTINRYEFYVEIRIRNHDDNEYLIRLINQNELKAIQTQIIISNLIDEEDETNPYTIFNRHYLKIIGYQKIIKYFNILGIPSFENTKSQYFNIFEDALNDNFSFFEQQAKSAFNHYTDNTKNSTYRIIGEIIHSNQDVFERLIPYIKYISDKPLPKDIFERDFKKFLKKVPIDDLFDTFKLGYKFCQYFLNLKNKNIQNLHITVSDSTIIDDIYKLEMTINFDFHEKLLQSFAKNNLLFLKVTRPSHCYHCIASIKRLIPFYIGKASIFLNEKTLIFCQNDDFVERIINISKTPVKDSKTSDSNLTYFIVHPETLNEEKHSYLVEFLNARMNSLYDQNLPKIFVISSLDYRTFCTKNLNNFDDIEIKIPRELIKYLCNLSHTEYIDCYSYQLYYSEEAGSGKTNQIIQDFTNRINCIIPQYKSDNDNVLKSIFVDSNTTKLPKLIYVDNNEEKEYNYLHLDLSPELFNNPCNRFFDDLWTFTVLNYQLNSDGTITNIPENVFFEVPPLTKEQFPDGCFINKYDFPIFCNHYHKISVKNLLNEDETRDKEEETRDKKEEKEFDKILAQILIPESVKKFCDIVFEEDIKYTIDLLKISLKMFYPNINIDANCIVPRMIDKINIFMDNFCQNLSLDNENNKAIFLLLLRTNFHIWNMESIFVDKNQPKSFIIMSNQNLFSNNFDKKKWNLLCFCSIDEHQMKWNIEFLKEDIKNFGDIDESNLFENELFKRLQNNKNIDIYSNHPSFNNYENDQAYFFSIMRSFFYLNPRKETSYRKITDGVILNNVKNSDSFGITKELLPQISNGPNAFGNSSHKWTKVFDSLYSIFTDYKENENDLINKLSNNETVKEISKIGLTMTFVKQFVIMILRIILKQPAIFEGVSGVGKTYTANMLKTLIEIAKENEDFQWTYHQIDCHNELKLDQLLQIQEHELKSTNDPDLNHVFFFDKLDTSPVSHYVINEMNNYEMKKKNLHINTPSISFVAAINSHDDIQHNFNKSPSIIKSDPELFYFDENDNKIDKSIYLYPDEIKIIDHIINYYLSTFDLPKTNLQTIINDEAKLGQNLEIIQEILMKYKKDIKQIMISLISKSFLEIRELYESKSILSYRDVKRSIQFFNLFFTKLIKVFLRREDSPDLTRNILINQIIPQSIVLSIMISIVNRFSDEIQIETSDGNISSSNEEEEKILSRYAKFGLKLTFAKDKKYYTINTRSNLLENLLKIEWPKPFVSPKDWNQIVISYSWLKCMKYVYNENNDFENKDILKLNTLMINLFSISSCYSVRKFYKDCNISCMIVGMPETSKTLSVKLFNDYKHRTSKSKDKFFYSTYLSTRFSKFEGINAQYKDCETFVLTHKDSFSVFSIDHLAIENLNEIGSFDHILYKDSSVMIIVTSNYPLNDSFMNQFVLVYDDLPTDENLAESFYFSEIEKEKITTPLSIINKYKNNYFNENNDFFNWKKDANNKIDEYKNFIQILWELTDTKEKPTILSLRSLYLLFMTIFKIYVQENNENTINNLCLYLISIISCCPSDSFEKLKQLINRLHLNQSTLDIDNQVYDNYKLLRRSIIQSNTNKSKRGFCIKTKNYECLDFIEELLSRITKHYFEQIKKVKFVHIYPNDFKSSEQITADESLINIINNSNKEEEDDILYFFIIIGNTSLTDSLLDVLNSSNVLEKPLLISSNDFTLKLERIPNNINFCFIMNEEDFIKRDSFSISLLNRLDHFYIDYDQKDEFDIIEKYREYRDENVDYSIPYMKLVHDYFNRFVKRLKDIPITSDDDKFAVVFATSDIVSDCNFTKDADYETFELDGNYDKIKWNKKIILVKFYRHSRNHTIYLKNIDKFECDENHEIVFYWSYELDQINEVHNLSPEIEIPFPKPENYDYFLSNEGSINNLIEKIENGEIEVNDKKSNKAIIVTTSPLMDDIKLDGNNEEEEEHRITNENTLFLFDKFITNTRNFEDRIRNENKRNIIFQSNQFQIEHDRYLRHLLEQQENKSYLIIIYHVNKNEIPKGLYTSKNWPVFWIESITNSPLSEFSTSEIVDCILFKDIYEERIHSLLTKILKQIYNDVADHFEKYIEHEKADNVLEFIYIKLKEKRCLNGKPILDINFSDLINKIEGKTNKDSFKNLDIKREFFNIIINQIPFIKHLIQVLVMDQNAINQRPIEETTTFISKLFYEENMEKLFEKADLDNFDSYNTSELYFPELILPQALSIYKAYICSGDFYPKIDKKVFQKFFDLQANPDDDHLNIFCNCFFMGYLVNNYMFDESKFDGFIDKLRELIK